MGTPDPKPSSKQTQLRVIGIHKNCQALNLESRKRKVIQNESQVTNQLITIISTSYFTFSVCKVYIMHIVWIKKGIDLVRVGEV